MVKWLGILRYLVWCWLTWLRYLTAFTRRTTKTTAIFQQFFIKWRETLCHGLNTNAITFRKDFVPSKILYSKKPVAVWCKNSHGEHKTVLCKQKISQSWEKRGEFDFNKDKTEMAILKENYVNNRILRYMPLTTN